MTMVIHNIEDKRKVIREIHSVLRSRGRYVVLSFSHNNLRKQVLSDFKVLIEIDMKRFPTIPYLEKNMRYVWYSSVHRYP